MKYRNNIEVISQILKVANGGNTTKTKIMYKALLGYNQLKEHLELLTEKDFATTKTQEHLKLLKKV